MESIPYNIPVPPQSFYVFAPLQFGTAIALNGLIRVLARRHSILRWVVKSEYIHAVRQMISDVPNVQVLAAIHEHEVRSRWLPQCPLRVGLGCFSAKGDIPQTDAELYAQAGVPFDARWTECKFPKALIKDATSTKKPVALVYETDKFLVKPDFLPDKLNIFRMVNRSSALDWIPEMLSASELHFIDSSFLKLAESLHAMGALPNTTLVFHKYAKGTPGPELRGPWKIFD
jgi:hypothetical protein